MIPTRAAVGAALFAALLCARSAAAESEARAMPVGEYFDAVLVMDGSASMLLTDPERLRDQGAQLFNQFLKVGDRLAILQFSDKADVVRPLSPFDPDHLEQLDVDLAKIEAKGEYTNILAGMRLAKKVLEEDPREDAQRFIVLLSDGKMDPHPLSGDRSSATTELLDHLLPELKARNIKVYTLAFSDLVDSDLLASIALGTDGINWFTPNADKLHESFADLFLAVKKPQIVPLTTKGFQIDAEVQEATFYVNRGRATEELEVMTPSGTKLNANVKDASVKWFHGHKFDVITLLHPEPGPWRVLGVPPEDGFATVLTDLKLQSTMASTITAGWPTVIEAQLYESDRPVSLQEVAQVSRFAFQIVPTDKVSEPIIRDFLVDDGKNGDRVAGDGVFSAQVSIDDPGEYRLRIVAHGPTFQRHQQLPFRVKPPLITVSVVSGSGSHAKAGEHGHGAGDEHSEPAAETHADPHAADHADHAPQADPSKGEPAYEGTGFEYFKVSLSEEATDLKKIEVNLVATDQRRRRYKLFLNRAEGKIPSFEASTAHLSLGEYRVVGTITALGRRGAPISEESKPIIFKKVQGGPAPTVDDAEIVLGYKEPEKPKTPWAEFLVALILNAGVGIAAILTFKKFMAQLSLAAPSFSSNTAVESLISSLEKKLEEAEVDLNDARYSAGSPASAAAPAPAAEPAGEATGGEAAPA